MNESGQQYDVIGVPQAGALTTPPDHLRVSAYYQAGELTNIDIILNDAELDLNDIQDIVKMLSPAALKTLTEGPANR